MNRARSDSGSPSRWDFWVPGILFAMGLVIAGHALFSPPIEERLSRELARGAHAYDRGKHVKGFIHFRKALALDGTNTAAGSGVEKFRLMREARRIDPKALKQRLETRLPDYRNDPHALVLLAGAALRANRYEESVSHIRRALELNDRYPNAWYYLARIERERGNLEEAIQSFEKAIQLSPDVFRYRRHLVITLLERTDANKAVEALHRVIENLPDLEQYVEMYIDLMRTDQINKSLFMQKTLMDQLESLPDLEDRDAIWCITGASATACLSDENQKIAFVYNHYLLSSYIAAGGKTDTELEQMVIKQNSELTYNTKYISALLVDLADDYAAHGDENEREVRIAVEKTLKAMGRDDQAGATIGWTAAG